MITFYRITAFFTLICSSFFIQAADFETNWDEFYQNIPSDSSSVDYGTFFQRNSGVTSSSSTGPASAASGSYYLYLETSSGQAYDFNDTAILETGSIWQQYGLPSAGSMSFFYHMYGADTGTLAVEVKINSTWERIWEISGQQHSSSTAAWSQHELNLDVIKATLGNIDSVRFVAIAKGGYRGDIAIDKVEITASNNSTLFYKYDELGRLVCTLDPNNGDRVFEYDAAGNRDYVSVGTCNE